MNETKQATALNLNQFDGHTPGPWSVQARFTNLFAVMAPHQPPCPAPSDVANNLREPDAHLIAAAPALLSECRRQREELRDLDGELQASLARGQDWLAQIAKLREALRVISINGMLGARNSLDDVVKATHAEYEAIANTVLESAE
jgi:hypothetical protein